MRKVLALIAGAAAGLTSSAGVLLLGLGHQGAGLALFIGGIVLLAGMVTGALLFRGSETADS